MSSVEAQSRRLLIRLGAAMIALVLITAACTTSTTIDSSQTVEPPIFEPTVEPVTPEPTPTESVADEPDEPDGSSDDAQNEEAEGEPTPAPEPTEPVEIESTDDSSSGNTVEVVLIDAGAEPRSELRLMIAASCGEVMMINQTQEITQTLDGVALPAAGAVGTIVEVSTSAAQVGDNYETEAEITAAYASPDVSPAAAAGLNLELARLVGITTFLTITDRGVQVPDSYQVSGAEALGPLQSAVESVSQVQAPLPVEPVGIGARWQVTNVVEFEGADLVSVTEYVITDRDGTIVEMDVTATQTVEIGSTMNLQGFDVAVTEWTGTTEGETTIDLATISPIRAVSTTQAAQGLDFGDEGVLLQDIESQIILTSEPSDGCTGRTISP